MPSPAWTSSIFMKASLLLLFIDGEAASVSEFGDQNLHTQVAEDRVTAGMIDRVFGIRFGFIQPLHSVLRHFADFDLLLFHLAVGGSR